jgi:hypothetical protein
VVLSLLLVIVYYTYQHKNNITLSFKNTEELTHLIYYASFVVVAAAVDDDKYF